MNHSESKLLTCCLFRYLGRKLLYVDEPYVKGSSHIVEIKFTHWTIGYILTRRGAERLLKGDPLSNLIPLDEYIPVMYDEHPDESLNSLWPVRDLKVRVVRDTH